MLDVKVVFTPLAQQTGRGLEGANDVVSWFGWWFYRHVKFHKF